MARFADKDDFGNVGRFDNFVEFGEILIIGLVAAAEDEDDLAIGEGIDGDASGGWVGREVVVVVFDVIKFS